MNTIVKRQKSTPRDSALNQTQPEFKSGKSKSKSPKKLANKLSRTQYMVEQKGDKNNSLSDQKVNFFVVSETMQRVPPSPRKNTLRQNNRYG